MSDVQALIDGWGDRVRELHKKKVMGMYEAQRQAAAEVIEQGLVMAQTVEDLRLLLKFMHERKTV